MHRTTGVIGSLLLAVALVNACINLRLRRASGCL